MKSFANFKKKYSKRGFSVVEIILAAAIFCIFSTAAVIFLFSALKAEQQANQAGIALQYASQGIEAVRAIRDDSYDRLAEVEQAGLIFSDGQWDFSGEFDEFEDYRRSVNINNVRRNGDGDIVSEGGDEDPDMKIITVTVFWNSLSNQELTIELKAYLADWK